LGGLGGTHAICRALCRTCMQRFCWAAHQTGATHDVTVQRKVRTMEDEQEEVERVRDWIGRLEAFASAFDDIDGESATDFANNALEALQAVVMPHIVPAKTPAM